jgi:hypothetical protein
MNLTDDAICCRDLVILLIILIEIHLCNIFSMYKAPVGQNIETHDILVEVISCSYVNHKIFHVANMYLLQIYSLF